jgi:hypothetical protein
MNYEQERMWKEAFEIQFWVLSWPLPGGTDEENYTKPQTG